MKDTKSNSKTGMRDHTLVNVLCLSFLLLAGVACQQKEEWVKKAAYAKPEIERDPPIHFLSPEESMKTFYLPEGYHAELVASEPLINEPVAMAWDANGRLFVAQMDTYMQDIDGKDEYMPWSKIALLEDLDGDGRMDKSTVYIDSLVLPRIILPLDDRLIVGETFKHDLWSYRDTNGDGVADEKILLLADDVYDHANLEHQAANLTWNIDNWLYLSRHALRYRMTSGTIEVDTMRDAPSGQWGLSQDETGRMFYSSAGGEVPALGYQLHPVYGSLEMEGKWEEGFVEPWPVIGTPDVQGGLRRLRPDGTLNHFTASCGQTLFLGDRMAAYGDLFIPEPVGRLVRRAKVENINGKIVLNNAYEQTEFLASTDANFRPVDSKTGPDGCLYIVDMYRGIIQEGNWVREGSFLREVVKAKGIDKNIGKGRIYRIVHDDHVPRKTERLLGKSSQELLPFLGDPNGWYRMNAQKLIILKRDSSIVPSLESLALDNEPFLGSWFSDKDFGIERLHALWTLEGLDALGQELIFELLEDDDQRVRCAAIRNCEKYLASGDVQAFTLLSEMIEDPDKNVQIQLGLSMRSSKSPEAKLMIAQLMKNDRHNMVLAVTGQEGIKETTPEIERLKDKFVFRTSWEKRSIVEGYKNYKGLCIDCHGKNGEGIGDIAPPLKGSPRVLGDRDQLIRILLNGLQGPLNGKEYSGVMIPMKANDDKWLADVLTYIRADFNNESDIRPNHVKRIRETEKDRGNYWTLEELEINQ